MHFCAALQTHDSKATYSRNILGKRCPQSGLNFGVRNGVKYLPFSVVIVHIVPQHLPNRSPRRLFLVEISKKLSRSAAEAKNMRLNIVLFLCVIVICSALRMPLKRVFPRLKTSIHADDANTDPTPTETTPPAKTKSPFLDLFAAGDRKNVVTPSPSPPPTPTTPVPSTPVAVDKPVVSTPSITPVPAPAPGPMSSRNTFMEMQAELLRLEAEKEQLEIDQERLAAEKKRLEEIDGLILKLLDGR